MIWEHASHINVCIARRDEDDLPTANPRYELLGGVRYYTIEVEGSEASSCQTPEDYSPEEAQLLEKAAFSRLKCHVTIAAVVEKVHQCLL